MLVWVGAKVDVFVGNDVLVGVLVPVGVLVSNGVLVGVFVPDGALVGDGSLTVPYSHAAISGLVPLGIRK